MKITDEILEGIRLASEHYGNNSQLAKAMGIAHSTILFWLTGKTRNMSGQLWVRKIRPVLAPFLSSSQLVARDPLGPYSTCVSPVPAAVPRLKPRHNAPVISVSELEQYDPALESLSHFLRERSSAAHRFSAVINRGSFCFRSEELVRAAFPAGSFILVSFSRPDDGDYVIARLRDTGKIVLRRYERKGNEIVLSLPPGENGSVFRWNATEKQGVLLWAFPLVELNMSLSGNDDSIVSPEEDESPVPAEEEDSSAVSDSVQDSETARETDL